MVARSILSALLFTVAFLELSVSATALNTKGIQLEPRAVDNTLEPRQAESVSTSTSTSVEISTFIQQWSSLPPAFSKCHSVFQQRPSVQVAVEAVTTLRTEVQTVSSRCGSCNSCGQSGSVQFKRVISQVFTSWYSILVIGKEVYGAAWEFHFRGAFEGFTQFLSTVKSLCVSFELDLDGILVGINLDLDVFVGVGININGILGGVTGLLGGVLGSGSP